MFKPKYTITDKLLSNIKQINSIVLDLDNRRFSKVVLYELEKAAREISAFASTSIEGNPLPLTDVIVTKSVNTIDLSLLFFNFLASYGEEFVFLDLYNSSRNSRG